MTSNKNNTLAIISILGLAIALLGVVYFTGSDIDQNTLSVSGQAELTVAPDKADVYLSIITNGTDAVQAQERNRVLADSVMTALRNAGVPS